MLSFERSRACFCFLLFRTTSLANKRARAVYASVCVYKTVAGHLFTMRERTVFIHYFHLHVGTCRLKADHEDIMCHISLTATQQATQNLYSVFEFTLIRLQIFILKSKSSDFAGFT